MPLSHFQIHCILGHIVHARCFKLIPSPVGSFLSLSEVLPLDPFDFKSHNVDDISIPKVDCCVVAILHRL
jgi:hypothetical protein